jgi:ATPase domain predominantly from Archaea
MIPEFDKEAFEAIIAEHFTPSKPISRLAHLYGRERKLKEIERAFASPGKHLFVFGDRGVGKTSMARTTAALRAGTDAKQVPFVSCDKGASFFDMAANVNREILRVHPKLIDNLKVEASIDAKFLKLSASKQLIGDAPTSAGTVHEVCDTLRLLTKGIRECVVIVDEFDQIAGDEDKKYFADLIKQVSDRELPVRFMLTGIGRSLEELIGVHLSTDRYVAPIALEPIPHDARWQILHNAAQAIGVKLDRDAVIRIGQISDGFPYYIHLIGEKLFWAAFDSSSAVKRIDDAIYGEGLKLAIEETQTSLKTAYDVATMKHKNSEDYEHALWAVADGPMLKKQVSDIYSVSYLRICTEIGRTPPLSKEAFYQRLNKLKKPAHGCILDANRQGWYEFSENVVRGYVRLRAERAGVHIGVDHIRGA